MTDNKTKSCASAEAYQQGKISEGWHRSPTISRMEAISRFELASITQTERFGQALGQLLFPGAVVALIGPLGAGKTILTRAIAHGMGLSDPSMVTSPTFVLIQEYHARLPIYHFDVYRLKQGSDFIDLGAAEYFAGTGVSIVEWADKVTSLLPSEHLQIELQIVGEQQRQAVVTARGERYSRLLSTLQSALATLRS